jgi:hypothetical protein
VMNVASRVQPPDREARERGNQPGGETHTAKS